MFIGISFVITNEITTIERKKIFLLNTQKKRVLQREAFYRFASRYFCTTTFPKPHTTRVPTMITTSGPGLSAGVSEAAG